MRLRKWGLIFAVAQAKKSVKTVLVRTTPHPTMARDALAGGTQPGRGQKEGVHKQAFGSKHSIIFTRAMILSTIQRHTA